MQKLVALGAIVGAKALATPPSGGFEEDLSARLENLETKVNELTNDTVVLESNDGDEEPALTLESNDGDEESVLTLESNAEQAVHSNTAQGVGDSCLTKASQLISRSLTGALTQNPTLIILRLFYQRYILY